MKLCSGKSLAAWTAMMTMTEGERRDTYMLQTQYVPQELWQGFHLPGTILDSLRSQFIKILTISQSLC